MKRWEEESKWSWLMIESETFVGTTVFRRMAMKDRTKQ